MFTYTWLPTFLFQVIPSPPAVIFPCILASWITTASVGFPLASLWAPAKHCSDCKIMLLLLYCINTSHVANSESRWCTSPVGSPSAFHRNDYWRRRVRPEGVPRTCPGKQGYSYYEKNPTWLAHITFRILSDWMYFKCKIYAHSFWVN